MIEAFERAPLDKICAFDNLIHFWPLTAYSFNNEYFLVKLDILTCLKTQRVIFLRP